MDVLQVIKELILNSGFAEIIRNMGDASLDWVDRFGTPIMILLSFVLMYLAIVKKFEPLLLLPIAFGMLLCNFPLTGIVDEAAQGLIYYLSLGVKYAIYPSIIFMGIGAMTDFAPLIANPNPSLLAFLSGSPSSISENTTPLASNMPASSSNVNTKST